jgi:hypothetical protein
MIETDPLPAFGVDVGAAREHLAGLRLNARRVHCHRGSRRCAAGVLAISRQVTGPALTSGGHARAVVSGRDGGHRPPGVAVEGPFLGGVR